ncbi:Na(+)-translocating NADH-quinone reductase subunit C [Nannocystis bainbridge]|uniref:Na(+)-translocating NADH-quinone reductase subunit C n=1 Tax=Nannocystis bainbridge TaxID=2995303 RepID=A0ABT5E2R2_9BACT|nr:Na(+)-translocating NADH-quinone reductase subunit C [Nannocystis bainbridge]MDC0720157.1 Na(+)-translocating NADH-quinone reductase subunit C [Nannocystis bainbridge]
MAHSTGYTIGFAALVCVVCGVGIASAAVALADRQAENKKLDQQKQVLAVAGLMQEGETLKPDEVKKRFADNIKPEVVDLKGGVAAQGVDPAGFDQRKAQKDPAQSREAPPNNAKVLRLPNNALVYKVLKDGKVDTLIFPIEGYGLWSTLYGFIALDAKDTNTVKGITFYQHGETPGLGGEVDNPKWKALWPGRKVYGDKGEPQIAVVKGQAGPAASDAYRVDGLSGATITSNGVTSLVRFWFGPDGFGPYIQHSKAAGGK